MKLTAKQLKRIINEIASDSLETRVTATAASDNPLVYNAMDSLTSAVTKAISEQLALQGAAKDELEELVMSKFQPHLEEWMEKEISDIIERCFALDIADFGLRNSQSNVIKTPSNRWRFCIRIF